MNNWAMPSIGVISMSYARPFTADHFPIFERIANAGLEFCELLAPEPGELDPTDAASAAQAAGLDLVLAARINLSRDLASDDPGCHAAGVAYLKYCVDVAVACGAKIVGGPLYGAPLVFAGRAPAPIDDDQRIERVMRVVSGLQHAATYALDNGVKLAVEPLNRFETDFCNTAGQAVELVKMVGSDAIGVLLDTFHMNMEEDDLGRAIRRTGRHLVHFQANENHRGFLGTGHLDWPAICRALGEARYAGPITLEPFRRTDHRLSVPLAQWRPPTDDEDSDMACAAGLLHAALHAAGAR